MEDIYKKGTEMLNDWAVKNNLIDLFSLDNTSAWWWMNDFLFSSENFCNNFKDVLNKRPVKKVHLLKKFTDIYFKKRYLIRWLYSYKFKLKKDKRKKIVFFVGLYWNNDRAESSPLFEKLSKKYNVIIIDRASEYASDLSLMRLKGKLKSKGKFQHQVFEAYKPEALGLFTNGIFAFLRSQYQTIKFQGIFKKLKPQFEAYFKYRLKSQIRNYLTILNFLKTELPDCVFYLSEGGVFGNMLFDTCKLNDIPVVAMQHGFMPYSPKLVHKTKDFPKPNKICVFGKSHKDFLVKYGKYPSKDIVVTGHYRYDDFGCKHNDYKLNPDKKTILWAPHANRDQNKYFQEIHRIVKKLNAQLLIKFHPEAQVTLKKKVIQTIPKDPDIHIFQKEDVVSLLKISDAVIVFYSGVGLEAMMLNKPVVMLNFPDNPDKVDYAKKGAAYGVYDLKQLEPAINKALFRDDKQKQRKKYVKDCYYKMDGRATDRVIKVIEDAMQLMRK